VYLLDDHTHTWAVCCHFLSLQFPRICFYWFISWKCAKCFVLYTLVIFSKFSPSSADSYFPADLLWEIECFAFSTELVILCKMSADNTRSHKWEKFRYIWRTWQTTQKNGGHVAGHLCGLSTFNLNIEILSINQNYTLNNLEFFKLIFGACHHVYYTTFS
jgi:hypothetical protein